VNFLFTPTPSALFLPAKFSTIMDGLGGAHPPPWAFADACQDTGALCYGEVTRNGVSRMLALAPAPHCSFLPHDVIYDVGSGFGFAAATMREFSNVSKVVGVEVNECRARVAASSPRGRMQGLTFVHGDIRKVGFSDATHLYLTSQCWPKSLLRAIFGRLARSAPRLRCIMDVGSLDALVMQDIPGLASAWGLVRTIALQVTGTWDAHAAAVYVTKGRASPGSRDDLDDDDHGRDGRDLSTPCNRSQRSCAVRRARALLVRAAKDGEADATAATLSPWRPPPALINVL
jgi:SAM-dependent methyltransferase